MNDEKKQKIEQRGTYELFTVSISVEDLNHSKEIIIPAFDTYAYERVHGNPGLLKQGFADFRNTLDRFCRDPYDVSRLLDFFGEYANRVESDDSIFSIEHALYAGPKNPWTKHQDSIRIPYIEWHSLDRSDKLRVCRKIQNRPAGEPGEQEYVLENFSINLVDDSNNIGPCILPTQQHYEIIQSMPDKMKRAHGLGDLTLNEPIPSISKMSLEEGIDFFEKKQNRVAMDNKTMCLSSVLFRGVKTYRLDKGQVFRISYADWKELGNPRTTYVQINKISEQKARMADVKYN